MFISHSLSYYCNCMGNCCVLLPNVSWRKEKEMKTPEEIKESNRTMFKLFGITFVAGYSFWIIKAYASLTMESLGDFLFYTPFAYYTGNVLINSFVLVTNIDEYYDKNVTITNKEE